MWRDCHIFVTGALGFLIASRDHFTVSLPAAISRTPNTVASHLDSRAWWRAGFVMSLVYLAIWFTIGPVWWTLLGLTHVKF